MQSSEDHQIEYKASLAEGVAKEIVAFLNSEDGRIVVGVNKQREVVGIREEDIDITMRGISDIITDQISPRCIDFVHQCREKREDKNVIVIEVRKGNRLYYIKRYGLSQRGCYIREGSSCKPLEPDEIMARYTASLDIPEKDIAEMPSGRERLSFRILKNYLVSNGFHFNEETFETNLHLRTKKGEYNYLAEILADENDIVINVATFATENKTIYLKRDEFGGKCLLLAMEQAKNYVEALNQTFVLVGNGKRKEKKMFDIEAFEQAWYNACVHNKWAEADNPGIYVYSNRLEVESFGGIPKSQTKEDFLRGISRPVNPKLFTIFKACGFGEESGHGVPAVVDAYGKGVFRFSEHVIDVTIPFDKNGFNTTQKNKGKINQKNDLDNNRRKTKRNQGTINGFRKNKQVKNLAKISQKNKDEINQKKEKGASKRKNADILNKMVDLLESNPRLSRKDLVLLLGLDESGVKYRLAKLQKTNVIQRIGPDKGGYWKTIAKPKKTK